MVDSFARPSTSNKTIMRSAVSPMQGNAYLIKAFTFSGRFEGGPFSRFSHVGSLQVLVQVRNMETCATTRYSVVT